MLEGAGSGGYGASGNYFGAGTAYHNASVYSYTAAYNAIHFGYYFGGESHIGGSTSLFAIGTVSVTDSMATGNSGKGFEKFQDLKDYLGSAGENNHWHHIVEQCQIDKSGFSPQQIHNTNNIVAINSTIHSKISGYYSSKPKFTKGLSIRDWLAGRSFEFQTQFGWDVYYRLGGK